MLKIIFCICDVSIAPPSCRGCPFHLLLPSSLCRVQAYPVRKSGPFPKQQMYHSLYFAVKQGHVSIAVEEAVRSDTGYQAECITHLAWIAPICSSRSRLVHSHRAPNPALEAILVSFDTPRMLRGVL